MAKRAKARPAKPAQRKPADRLGHVRFWLLVFFLFSMPLFFTPWNTEYGFIKSVYTLAWVSVLLVLWGVEGLVRRELKLELSWLFPVVPALLVAALLSLTGKTPACVVLQSATLLLYFGLIFLLVANSAQTDRELVWVLGALVLGGLGNALLALLQHVGVAPGGADPIIATMGNRQFLAGYLSYLVLPTGILLLRLRKDWTALLALVVGGFNLAVMLLTRQIGVRLGVGAGLAFVAFGLGLWPARGAKFYRWGAAALVVLAALGAMVGWQGLLGGLGLALLGSALWGLGRLLRRFPWAWAGLAVFVLAAFFLLLPVTTPIAGVRQLWERQSGAVRAWDWWVGYEMWKQHPVAGIGLGGYKIYFVPYKVPFLASPARESYAFPFPRADQAHNEYVQVAAELGTVGTLVMAGGMVVLVYLGLGRVARQPDPNKRLELLLLGGGLISVFVHAIPTFPFHLPASSLAFVSLLGLVMSPRYGPLGSWAVRVRRRALSWSFAVTLVLGTVVSVVAIRDATADASLLAGQVALQTGDVKGAKARLTRAVELDFCPRVSLYYLATAYARDGEIAKAQELFRRCLRLYRPEGLYINLAAANVQIAMAKETQGDRAGAAADRAEAKALIQELLATIPFREQELEARYLLATIVLHEGEYLQAREMLETIVVLDPMFERGWIGLGDIARGRYLWAEARKNYERALAVMSEKERRITNELRNPLPLDRYGDLQAELSRLRTQRTTVEARLRELP